MNNVVKPVQWWNDRQPPHLPPEPPEPPHMDQRVIKLELAAEHVQRDLNDIKTDVREIRRDMRTDFRLLFGALIAVALGLAGLMARGFHWL